MTLDLDAVEGIEPGSRVVVAIDRSPLAGTLVLFGLPLAGLVGGAVIGYVFPFLGMSADGSAAILGLVFLVLAFLAAIVYDRKVAARRTPKPRIVSVVTEEQG